MVSIPTWLENGFHFVADLTTAAWPQKIPATAQVERCHIVAHRGVHTCGEVVENTVAAFDRALEVNLWGIEFDVRWTADNVPVVFHDADCRRVFRSRLTIAETKFAALRAALPQIPSLAEVVHRYAKRLHLMIELKPHPALFGPQQHEALSSVLRSLDPLTDFHLLASELDLLESLDFVPKRACLALSRLDVQQKSQFVLEHDYGGLLGHYALLPRSLIAKHAYVGQHVGTGFVDSRNCFYREVNRGVRLIFTNSPTRLVQWQRDIVEDCRSS